jgi:2-keto-4-pentenoate hydratase
MIGFDPIPAAEALIAARDARRTAGPLPAAIAPRDEAEAALVQRAVAERRGAWPVGGFKIGATGTRMQRLLGLDHPCAGFMARADMHRSGVALPFAAFRNVAVECELAVRLGADLPPGLTTPEVARAAVAELFAAIEIVENRYGPSPVGDLKAVGTPTMIADQVYHAACVLGDPPPDWRALDLRGIEGRAFVDGGQRDAGRGAELLGDPMRGLAWLAGGAVAASFGGLRAGQVVMLGSVTPSIWLDAPCEVRIDFDGLPPVALRLT